jgi:hypothetical protein
VSIPTPTRDLPHSPGCGIFWDLDCPACRADARAQRLAEAAEEARLARDRRRQQTRPQAERLAELVQLHPDFVPLLLDLLAEGIADIAAAAAEEAR